MIEKKLYENKADREAIADRKDRRFESMSKLDKKLLIAGLFGISPIPIAGEIGMFILFDHVLEYSSFSKIPKKCIAACTALLTRLYGIYPLYAGLYKCIQNLGG